MALAPGSRVGPYEVIAALGAGGMGAVFRARDTKLDRDVAIKVLPESFASDAERVARFTREARTLAALNHPHIAQIYGVEDSGATRALVMELVEGIDLSDRIARGAMSVEEALPIARQIADALAAAHEQGIVHRDLKPANIRITTDEVVKVLDFGLAKLAAPDAGSERADAMFSPTITSPAMMTGAGVILGTAAYMAPEQAKGRAADKRSDVWAFGCVLYEMLTGRRPYDGEDVADTLANVLKSEPDWSALPASVSPAVRALLEGCLVKDRRRRVADISTAQFVLERGPTLTPTGTLAPPSTVRTWSRRLVAARAAALVAGAAAGAAITFLATRSAAPIPPRVSRLQIPSSGTAALSINGNDRDIAITPDGLHVVYIGNNGTQIFVRALEALEPVAVYRGAPREPFVSPDGQWIGFVEAGNILKRVALTGGPATTLATLDGIPRGATWAPDGSIIVGTDVRATGLQRVAPGGAITELNKPDRTKGEQDYFWPEFLPDGRGVLFTITALAGGLDAAQVAVLDLHTGSSRRLIPGGTHAHYVAGPRTSTTDAGAGRGYLVYAAGGALRAAPFDLAGLEVMGPAVPVVASVMTTQFGALDAAIAADGTLAYVSGGSAANPSAPRQLIWVDRQGAETPIPAPLQAYATPRLSPDDSHFAVAALDRERDLWLWDFAHPSMRRLTFEPGTDANPLWTPDSRALIFSSSRDGQGGLYIQPADGTAPPKPISESVQRPRVPTATRDGVRVVFTELTQKGTRDLRLLTLTTPLRTEALVETAHEERNADLSPNGRWLVYESNKDGPMEIYVRPFPNTRDGEYQVSTTGGINAVWARNGRELFYMTPDGALMSVPVDTKASSWSPGPATRLFTKSVFSWGSTRHYDVSLDAKRFLMIKQPGAPETPAPVSLTVVQHWNEELKRLVPAK